jgi:NAD(P)-dependent dehydrogenase (short-subunit alcohol dehydrogenase family)
VVSRAVLITGCSSGIGEATARRLVRSGWQVYATARDVQDLDGLADEGAVPLRLDVTDRASMDAAVDGIVAAHGAVGVLVNNAGYSQSGTIEEVPDGKVRRQFETNVFGPIHLVKRVLPGMREQRWGKIVNLSSIGGRLVFPGGGYYHATKHAIEALSDALRMEVRGFGIDTIVIEPGIIRTRFADAITAHIELDPDSAYAGFTAAVHSMSVGAYGPESSMGKLGGDADDVAAVIEKAIDARRPKTRYRVTPSAKVMLTARDLLPDRVWDAAMRRSFGVPSD